MSQNPYRISQSANRANARNAYMGYTVTVPATKKAKPTKLSKKEANKARNKLRGQIRGNYKAYLDSAAWANTKRAFKLQHKTGSCELCGSSKGLNVHHHTYTRVGQERLTDLALLCTLCHEKVHKLPDGSKTPMHGGGLKRRYKSLKRKSAYAIMVA
jgi:5-methylcytosine-specific restriction endonuclease McrA